MSEEGTAVAARSSQDLERPIPASEHKRLRALHNYRVLDTAPEQSFDELAKLASQICETPIAMVSLVDSDRQWFKARVGLDAEQTPRDESICQYTIMDDAVFEVEDATGDSRFETLPVVVGDPHLRFYAGAPLIEPGGERVGSLCVIDTKKRQLNDFQRTALESLSRAVVAQLDLGHAVRSLRQANERLEDFAYVAAHDLRAPLRAIASLASFVEEDLELVPVEETREHLDMLRGRARRLEGLIDALLDYVRAAAGSGVRETRPNEVTREIIRGLDAPENFEIHVQPGSPAVQFDPLRFEQVMLNLISNAIKYTHRPDGRLEIKHQAGPSSVTFEVRDNGPGIDPKYHEKIFGRFETLHARDSLEGTGIGLAIVKRAVEEEGGKVWVESELDDGAAFFFTAYLADDTG